MEHHGTVQKHVTGMVNERGKQINFSNIIELSEEDTRTISTTLVPGRGKCFFASSVFNGTAAAAGKVRKTTSLICVSRQYKPARVH